MQWKHSQKAAPFAQEAAGGDHNDVEHALVVRLGKDVPVPNQPMRSRCRDHLPLSVSKTLFGNERKVQQQTCGILAGRTRPTSS